ncbi:hypothetical protein GCM10010249_13290 [Streptomyces roseolilacinus]|uniref:Uncharacterized protein n=1 Tax=Streptomyces roseolilacinus TaxID=66904 RepID=A0A918EKA6_9ACTN|nr:hypothetical protein GCM10010249_13290 [Streptomyces roseolilacinus]
MAGWSHHDGNAPIRQNHTNRAIVSLTGVSRVRSAIHGARWHAKGDGAGTLRARTEVSGSGTGEPDVWKGSISGGTTGPSGR